MPLSYTTYQADGNTKQFAVPFGYLRRSHVFVFVDGLMTGFKWVSPTNIEIDPAPDDQASIRVQRLTDKVNRITDFADGQTLLAGDLDAATLQNFYIVQEMIDAITDGVINGDVVITNPPLPGNPITTQQIQDLLNEAARNSPVIDQLLNDTLVNADAIAAETTARLQALTDEQNARIAAVNGLQVQADATVADLAATTAALTQEIADRVAAVSAVNDAVTQEVTDRINAVQTNASNLAQEILDRQEEDNALDGRIDAVVASVGENSALIATEQQARIDGDTALAGQLTVIQSSVSDNTSQIASEITARTNADSAFTLSLNALTARVGDNEADIITVNEAVATESSARATAISGLQTQIDGNFASIASNATAISNETSARVSAISAIQTLVDDNAAAITAEATARSDADSAFTLSLNALTARVGDNEADIITVNEAISTEASARATAISGLQTQVDSANAAISNNATAISTETSARTSQFNSLSAAIENGRLRLFNGSFEHGLEGWSSAYTANGIGEDFATNDAFGFTPTRPAGGAAVQVSGYAYLASSWVLKLEEGRTYRYRMRVRTMADSTNGNTTAAALYIVRLDSNGDYISASSTPGVAVLEADGWVTIEYTFDKSQISGTPSYLRPMFIIGGYGSGAPSNGTMEIQAFAVDDITDVQEAKAEAAALVVSEQTARVNADAAIASDVTAITTRMGDAEADIIAANEAISNETSARVSALSALQVSIDSNEAAIVAEASARASADSVQAGQITGLQTRMDGAEANIVSNSNAISTANSSNATQFTAVNARLDSEAAAAGRGGDVRLSMENPTSFSRSVSYTNMDSYTALPNPFNGTYGIGTSAGRAAYISNVKGYVGPRFGIPVQPGDKITLRYTCGISSGPSSEFRGHAYGYSDPTTFLSSMLWSANTVSTADGVVTFEEEATVPAGVFFIRPYVYMNNNSEGAEAVLFELEVINTSRLFDIEASVISEQTARVNADAAIASDVTGLQTRMGDAEAGIVENATAISTETSARTTAISQISASVRDRGSSGSSFTLAADEDGWSSAISSANKDIFGLSASWQRVSTPYGRALRASIKTYLAPPVVRVTPGDKVRATFTGYVSTDGAGGDMVWTGGWYRYGEDGTDPGGLPSVPGWYQVRNAADGYTVLSVEFTVPAGVYYLRPYLYVNGIDGQTSEGNILSYEFENLTELDTLEASLTEVRDVLADDQGNVNAFYSLRANVNGHISGFGLSNDGVTSEFAILADKFLVADPGNPGDTPQGVFLIENGNVVINSARIGDAAIDTAKIANLSVKSFHLDFANLRDATINTAWISEAQIKNAAVTTAKIGNAAISSAKIADAAITEAKIGNAAITNAKIGDAAVDTLKVAGKAITSSDFGKWASAGGPWTPREFATNTAYQPWLVNKFEVPITGVLEPGREVMIAYDYDIWHEGQLCEYMAFWEKLYLVPTTTNITSTLATTGLVRSRIQEVTAFDGTYGNRMSTELRDSKPRCALPRSGSSIVVMPADADTVAYKAVFVWHLDRNTIPYSNGNQYGMKNWQIGSSNSWGLEDLEVHALHFKR
jgi:calcineurin-like phosphoesterase